MMNSLQSTPFHPVTFAADNAMRRAAMAEKGVDGKTPFDDLLPGHKTKEAEAESKTPSDVSARIKQWRRAEEDATAVKAQGADDKTMQEQPAQTVSVQQAMLAALPNSDVTKDEKSSEDTTAEDVAPNPPKLPPIEPHGPPVSGDETGGIASLPIGGTKNSPIDPHDPPVPLDDVPSGGTNDKPPVIRPHGPVNLAPPDDGREKASGADFVPPTVNAPKGPFTTTIPAPVAGAGSPVPLTPVNGLPKGEYTTTIPMPVDIPAETMATSAPTANLLAVTTAAQVQIAASGVAPETNDAAGVETMTVLDPTAANLAARTGQASAKGAGHATGSSLQVTNNEAVKLRSDANGMTTAERHATVTAFPSDFDADAERDTLFQQDADAFAGSDLPDSLGDGSPTNRAKDGNAVRAFAATALGARAAFATTPLGTAADPANAAPSAGIVRVDQVETLLQTVQDTAQKIQFDPSGQVELRVRFDGVADDVTVRVRLDENKQAQVSFQTESPQLRAALEQGWNDLSANAGATAASSMTLNTAKPSATPPVLTAATADAVPATTEFYREGRQVFSAETSTTDGNPSLRRWSGYA